MGLFDKRTEDDNTAVRKLNKLINNLNISNAQLNANTRDKRFIMYLEDIRKRPEATPIQPLSLFVDTAITIAENRADYHMKNYIDGIKKAEELYPKVFPFGEKTPDFEELSLIFTSFFHSDGLGTKGLFDPLLMSTFHHKQNYIELMNAIIKEPKIAGRLKDITQYGVSIRAYFLDDDSYAANMKHVSLQILHSGNPNETLLEARKNVEHMAGIYDIDEADVAKTEQQLVKATALLNSTVGILEEADRKTQQINRIMKDSSETIQEISKRETALISSKAASAREDIMAAYNGFLEEQRQEIDLQKDILISQIYQEAEGKLNELKAMAKTITTSANTELLRINKETSDAMEKIQDLVSNDRELKKILKTAEENHELYDKISKLEVLSSQNLETITKSMEAHLAAQPGNRQVVVQQAAAPVVAQLNVQGTPGEATRVVTTAENATDTIYIPEEETGSVDAPVNWYLNTTIPFKDRYAKIMEEKKKRIDQGEHFHKMFDDVLTILLEDANPYMIGPSGCGKTFMVKQIASLLNLGFTDIGYINEEYDILGFQTATGAYSATNFYRCYKYGKIAFCDELDNGNSRATVKLNSFLSNGKGASYSFPNGENVKRHANFRIIAAGNTAGNGADANYNTREKIEESVQQRFTPIYVGYDNAVEEKILKNYKDWYQFVVLFRKATDAWGNLNDCSAPGIITTRDTARIKRYLENGSLNLGRILEYEFIQTKDMEYLAFLSKHMGQHLSECPAAKQIFEAFNARVQFIREQGGIR